MLTFNTITASDSQLIEKFVGKFDPYSDFNFVSLYSWSKHSQSKFCIFNNCLFLKLPDYTTQKFIYTFLCNKDYAHNLRTFINWLKLNSLDVKFDILPSIVVGGLTELIGSEPTKWILAEDRNSFDYILDTKDATVLAGSKYSDFRYKLSLFHRTYGESIKIKTFDIKNKNNIDDAITLGKSWAVNRSQRNELYEDELFAYSRFLQLAMTKQDIDQVAIYSNNTLIALATFEIVNNEFAIGHFLKFNPEFKGIYYKLVNEVCMKLQTMGVKYINIEQDLGINGLRAAKQHLRPVGYLKKYSLSLID